MKKIYTTTLFAFTVLAVKAQQQPIDTIKLKDNIQKLAAARDVILARKDISISDAVPLLNGITQLMQSDADLLQFERAKKLKQEPKKQ